MLYLAEIQKQSKGFMGGVETKLKLIACQRNDRSWSPIENEFVVTDQADTFGDGALVVLDLGVNRQVQGTIESASQKIIGILKNFSRLLEKTKDQEQEIDQWKESLTIQSEELSRQKIEMETRFEQVEQMEEEFKQFEQQKEEIALAKAEAEKIKAEFEIKSSELQGAWEQLRGQQQSLETQVKESKVLDESQANSIREKLMILAKVADSGNSLKEKLNSASTNIKEKQSLLQPHWQNLNTYSESIPSRRQELEEKAAELSNRQQELSSLVYEIAQTHNKLGAEQKSLEAKQELRAFLELQGAEQKSLIELVSGSQSDFAGASKVDLNELENMPLPNLETIVANLKKDLEKVAQFVNDQEEELGWQCKAVEELEAKIAEVGEFERFTLEQELADEKEAKKMLDQTLVGQRRSLKERHQVLLQHSRILKRRQGIIDFDFDSEIPDIDLTSIKQGLEEQQAKLQQQQQELAGEIAGIEENIQKLNDLLEQQKKQKEELEADIAQKQLERERIDSETIEIQSQINFYQEQLQPLQDALDLISGQVEEMNQLMAIYDEADPHVAVEDIKLIIEDLVG
ncbi:MAG: pilus motility taxis protein HmpF [Cyanobacteria bacterium P01_G01_bin.19]